MLNKYITQTGIHDALTFLITHTKSNCKLLVYGTSTSIQSPLGTLSFYKEPLYKQSRRMGVLLPLQLRKKERNTHAGIMFMRIGKRSWNGVHGQSCTFYLKLARASPHLTIQRGCRWARIGCPSTHPALI